MKNGKNILTIIPARGGSKRLPRKNILEFCGKPLIAWSIEAATDSKYIDRIIVSTEDEQIAKVAINYGADFPFKRPSALSKDDSTTIEVVRHVLEKLNDNGECYEYVLVLQPTSPLRTTLHIDSAISLLMEKDADLMVGVTEVDHPIEWVNKLPSDLSLNGFLKNEYRNKRSQDFVQRYRINGAIYLGKTNKILSENALIFDSNAYAFVMDKEASIDIDSKLDFELASILMSGKN